MLYPTAGCRLFIANLPDTAPAAVPPEAWVQIGEAEALGLLGVEWDLHETTYIKSGCDWDDMSEDVVKGVMRRAPMPIILGNDPEDPGQAILWAASRSRAPFPFRLIFSDGVTMRRWSALVIALFDVFDSANAVMKMQATLRPVSPIERLEV